MPAARMARLAHASAVVTVQKFDDIAVLQVSGVLTPQASAAFKSWANRWAKDNGAMAKVWDCRNAVIALHNEHMTRAALKAAQDVGEMVLPAAMLVAPMHLELFRAYCWQAASYGINTVAFTDYASALDWARRQALVHSSWPAMRLPPASAECPYRADASVPARPESAQG